MDRGVIVEDAASDALFHAPHSERARDCLDSIPH